LALGIILAAFCGGEIFALETVDPFVFALADSLGSGGPHTSDPAAAFSMFVNPGLMREGDAALQANISVGAGAYSEDLLAMPPAFINVKGPLALAMFNKGLAFGAVNYLYMKDGDIALDLALAGGYAYPMINGINSRLYLGFLFKLFFRDIFRDPNYVAAGASLDAGMFYTFRNVITLGLACNDLYSVAGVFGAGPDAALGQVLPNLSVGLCISPVNTAGLMLSFYADYRYIIPLWGLDSDYAFPLKLSGGARITINNLVSISGGFAEMRPSAGIGINLDTTRLELAFYGRETGVDKIDNPAYFLELCLRVER
jgi:hypothetical protein